MSLDPFKDMLKEDFEQMDKLMGDMLDLDPFTDLDMKELDSFNLENYKEDFEATDRMLQELNSMETFTAADLLELDSLDFNPESDS